MVRLTVVLAAVVLTIAGCVGSPREKHGSISSSDAGRFGAWSSPAENELTEDGIVGKYFHEFTTGKTIIEIERERYRFVIVWSSGDTYESAWNKCALLPKVSCVSLEGMRERLMVHQHNAKFATPEYGKPLERELSPEECDTYPESEATNVLPFGYNSERELLLTVSVDPEPPINFLKMQENDDDDEGEVE